MSHTSRRKLERQEALNDRLRFFAVCLTVLIVSIFLFVVAAAITMECCGLMSFP